MKQNGEGLAEWAKRTAGTGSMGHRTLAWSDPELVASRRAVAPIGEFVAMPAVKLGKKSGRKTGRRGNLFARGSREDGDPMDDEDDYTDAVKRHVKCIGITPKEDADCMWIAEKV